MLIEIDNLDAGYGRRKVLEQVSLNFSGGAVGLLGPNGAGKTTLLKTMLGFIPPLGGRMKVFDMEVPAQARDIRSRVGYMPETEAFIPGMNAVNFVAYMGQLSGLPRPAAMERAHEVLQYVGLGEARYRNIETYSAGMKQRAKLAQAIVHDPALLLLDEPTNGMDPQGRIEMLELVSDLARNKNMSVILCSHLLKDVESVATQIIVLGNGRVLYKRMRDDNERQETSVYNLRVRGNARAFAQAVERLGAALLDGGNGQNLFARLPSALDSAIFFEAAAASGCTIQRLEKSGEKLEDLFTRALGELGDAHL
ncbi:MAG: ABC transporter ATP-binding protein [bacterium]|nr:ABC transporter ATP-binding protein [Candidatus Sumerlaeota bacterium]